MFVTYHFDAGFREVAQICEEIRLEIGVEPVTMSPRGELVNYNQADIAKVLSGTMTPSQYIEKNKCKMLE